MIIVLITDLIDHFASSILLPLLVLAAAVYPLGLSRFPFDARHAVQWVNVSLIY